MRAITLRPPWGAAIFLLGKDVENRSWAPPAGVVGERIAIHQGRTADPTALAMACGLRPDLADALGARGVVLGTVKLVGLVAQSTSPWFTGPLGWVLEDPQPFERVRRVRGRQGLWRMMP